MFLHFEESYTSISVHEKKPWPRRISLPSIISLFDGPRWLEFSVFFLNHFRIRRLTTILRFWFHCTILESDKCIDEEWASLLSGQCEERASSISWRYSPRFLEEYVTLIHTEAHLHDSEACGRFTIEEGMLYRRGSSILW